ncbi:DUF2254 domain-containing protein [Aequorivita echinoideorum]|uniref:DUF2254 domain-containing protein n=1 Tax=Aequorivita echinoideorum TaxID=1549647 RepID=A0ABS5S521_9FLAO|nr:DUF2254 domain-containing protein [Aequorivita echinoideorum]MBT0608311.1 DUF2254 domain-containing protein [Aequorivita echinoideorum]
MKKIFLRFSTFFTIIKNKIAFYPALMTLVGFALALVMIIWEKSGISRYLIEFFPLMLIQDGDTALNVLSACIGGLISMMVFSFSMVMLLLSQASSNFSPRLLPGLISNKRHQIILGLYLATIVYNIFTLFSIEPSQEKYTLPGLSVLLAVIFTIVCLSAFIFFIHNISQSIQINNIMDVIYHKAIDRLQSVIDSEKETKAISFPDTTDWVGYAPKEGGYFQNISLDNISKICKEHNTKLYITIPKGLFVLKRKHILKSEKPLSDEVLEDIFSNMNFARGEYIGDNYVLAFKQITEIAVKAMSPGINDPGTAINAIDYLTELFALRMEKSDSGIIAFDGTAYIKLAVIHFDELIYNSMASLRTYCKHDPIVVQKLLWMLNYLMEITCKNETYKDSVKRELKTLLDTMEFDTEADEKKIKNLGLES